MRIEGFSPQNLDDRVPVRCDYVDGEIVPYNSQRPPFKHPFMKQSVKKSEFWGLLSGGRSVIVSNALKNYSSYFHSDPEVPDIPPENRKMYRIKGCGDMYDPIWVSESRRRIMGGQTTNLADRELENTEKVNRIFIREGIKGTDSVIPLGRFDYKGLFFDGDGISASVYEIKSDMRLDEFMSLFGDRLYYPLKMGIGAKFNEPTTFNKLISKYLDISGVLQFFHQLGNYAGSLLSILHRNNLCWGTNRLNPKRVATNAHPGNYIVVDDDKYKDHIRLTMVDLDSVIPNLEILKTKEFEVELIKQLFLMGGIPSRRRGGEKSNVYWVPTHLREALVKGFDKGYEDPSFDPIPLEIS